MNPRRSLGVCKVNVYAGGVGVLHNPPSGFWRGCQEEGEGRRTLGSKIHSLPYTHHRLQTAHGRVDLSDQLLQYYSTHRRNVRWYRTLFLHFVDMATTNAYILHCEISATQQVTPMTHKTFLAELVSQLCGVNQAGVPVQRSNNHVPVAISLPTEAKDKPTQGCSLHGSARPVMFPSVILDRNCFEECHK